MPKKVVLAYSGGLDTTIITKWLVMKGYDVICCLLDLGQKVENLEAIKEKAMKCGAKKTVCVDAKEEFVSDYVFKVMKWNARYEGEYLLGTSMARPLIAKKQIEVANKEGAEYVSHGATGKGNDQVRFEMAYYSLKPDVKIIAPWKDDEFLKQFPGRQEMIAFAQANNIPVKATKNQPWSSDENLMHISFEAGMLEDPWVKPLPEMFELTVGPKNAPDKTTELQIDFEQGVPIAVNGKKLSPAKLLEKLNEIGGENGVGRLDMVENRFVGMKSRGVYETPGGTILWQAHKAIESITMDRDTMHLRDKLMPEFAEMVYYGFWFCDKMAALDAFIDATQKYVTGTVRLELYKGNIMVTGRKSPHSLYDIKVASMDDDRGAYNQKDAIGFIRLNALPQRVQGLKRRSMRIGHAKTLAKK
ncbi:argininosuccinate synthase [Candidatus Peregrinibacteria bacterium]|nr:argininosuccinate synthase [Candidatus Peregrinibacteria bacterium]